MRTLVYSYNFRILHTLTNMYYVLRAIQRHKQTVNYTLGGVVVTQVVKIYTFSYGYRLWVGTISAHIVTLLPIWSVLVIVRLTTFMQTLANQPIRSCYTICVYSLRIGKPIKFHNSLPHSNARFCFSLFNIHHSSTVIYLI